MITLKEALNYSQNELDALKKELNLKAKEQKQMGAYVEQFLNLPLSEIENEIGRASCRERV